MRRFLRIFSGAVLGYLAGTEALQACGDKFLWVGRGPSYRRAYAAIYPATIVLFAEPQLGASAAFRDKAFQKDLTLAGHTVVLVSAEQEFQAALKTRKIDLVLVDYADAERVARYAATTPSQPDVMQVMTQEEAKRLPDEKKKSLKTSNHANSYLESIDQAMTARVKQTRGKS